MRRGISPRSSAIAVIAIILVIVSAVVVGSSTRTRRSTTTFSSYTGQQGPMSFAVNDEAIAYGIPTSQNNAQTQREALDMLLSTGATCVRADIGFAPWLSGDTHTESVVNQTVQTIKQSGKCLIIADASSEGYRQGHCLDWSAFKTAWYERVATLASLYRPSYYIVVKEPGWYVPMVCDARTNPLFKSPQDWDNLTAGLADAVHKASPSTQVGVALSAGSLYGGQETTFSAEYLAGLPSSVAFEGLDVYSTSDQTAVSGFLSSNPPRVPLWIAEGWDTTTPTNNASQDAQGLKQLYQFSVGIGVREFVPFYTDSFVTPSGDYTQPLNAAGIEYQSIVAGRP